MPIPPLPDWPALLALYNQINQYGQANGMVLTVPTPGQAEYRMVIRPEHLSSPGTAHGGVLAGLMDAVLGAAALSLAFTTGELVSTVEFKINYFHPVHLGDELRATAQVEHQGRSLLVSSGVIYRRRATPDDGTESAVAQGLGTFNRYPATKRQLLPEAP
ncbi:hotdog fold thioesterase [Hymenobacter sp. HMF4947]|uniref:Hotdog fold thioesterase n=1 Tax=Hymenobacter ginkgonis TaxID=2682976 RepID=A0A7K1TC39_9BACT|nr:PaaI family thioesterase [Hymenobacter ginkgonis]MVN75980.1 hotdog fold thioesterase [Hymenobacter ginkgonis]